MLNSSDVLPSRVRLRYTCPSILKCVSKTSSVPRDQPVSLTPENLLFLLRVAGCLHSDQLPKLSANPSHVGGPCSFQCYLILYVFSVSEYFNVLLRKSPRKVHRP